MELGRVLAGTRTHAGLGSAIRGRRTLTVVTRAAPTTCQIKEVLEVKGWRAAAFVASLCKDTNIFDANQRADEAAVEAASKQRHQSTGSL